MNAIRPIAQTKDTVTLRRADYERLIEALEDAADIATLEAAAAREEALGEAAHADYLPIELAVRLAEGEHPVRIWREHRMLTQKQLAEAAKVGRSYIAEIEAGKKQGSMDAYRSLAKALNVPADNLMPAN